jgi:hypothetical protein
MTQICLKRFCQSLHTKTKASNENMPRYPSQTLSVILPIIKLLLPSTFQKPANLLRKATRGSQRSWNKNPSLQLQTVILQALIRCLTRVLTISLPYIPLYYLPRKESFLPVSLIFRKRIDSAIDGTLISLFGISLLIISLLLIETITLPK